MNAVTLIPRWPGILIGVLFMVVVLTACNDSTGSTPPTGGDSGAWEAYEAFCSEAAQEALDDNEDYTNGEVSAFYARLVERLESLDPPAEIADWHDRNLAGWTAVKGLVDAQPQDAIFDPFILFLDNEILSLFEEVGAAWDDIPADARERLAGCSDDDTTEPTGDGESATSLPDATAPADTRQSSTGPAFLPTCEPRSRDEAALVALYNATDGPNWRNNTNWLTDAPLGDWAGVSANRITSNDRVVGECVTALDLRRNQLSGEIPAALGNLLNLQRLDLSNNQLSGEIPAALGNLLRLGRLDLSGNQLRGEIPAELGSLLNLQRLDLSDNQLSGEIPAALGNPPHLQRLYLSGNQLRGEIPAELGSLLNLQRLDLSDNQLSGEIPAALGNPPHLQRLYLNDNQLSGEIPASLDKISHLILDRKQLSRPNDTNPQYTWEGSTIRISWDTVDGADYYKVYHDDFFVDACSLGSDGRPRFCEELAADVTGTTYVHANPTRPDGSANYYWVVSCNSDECSNIDSYNPAQLIGPPPHAALCSAVNYSDVEVVKALITAGVDVNETCQSETAWYDGLSPLVIAKRQGGPAIEAILVEAGAVDAEEEAPGVDSSTATPRGAPTPAPTETATPTSTPGPTSDTPISTETSSSARDRDGNGLIEVDNLTQLDAVRWDLDGDGISDNADYAAAFPDSDTGTLCSVESCAGYELTANLDFDTNGSGDPDEGDVYWSGGGGWIPIGESSDPFVATFEGGGHTISNLYIRRSPNVGLFGVLGSGSTVSGIGLVDTNVGASGYGTAGALAGIGSGVIEDSFADGLVAGCVDHIGGLVGLNEGSIGNSRSAGKVASARKSSRSAPGVITDLINDLIDFPLFGSGSRTCYASGGGLVGENSGTIASSHSTSVVSGFTDNFGGLAGVNSGVITGSYATGSVSGSGFADVGGLVGANEVQGKINTSHATGSVSGQGDNFGGLAGVNSGAITASYATGSVSGSGFADVGGLVGANEIEGKIITSHATGAVSGQGDNFGGLAGANSGVIAASYATGNVSGRGFADVGGLVGDNRYTGVITAVYAEGSVSGRADRYGGLLGLNVGVVTFCFSTGEVHRNGGGLIERKSNYSTVSNCYWDTETSNHSESAGGDGKTTAELQSPTGYTGLYADWNVDLDGDGSRDDPWIFGSGTEYPVLNLGTLDIGYENMNARQPLQPKANAALCSAVNYGNVEEVKAQITAGIDVNDTCQSETAWYDGLTPLDIAKGQGGPEVEAILVEAGAVDAEG